MKARTITDFGLEARALWPRTSRTVYFDDVATVASGQAELKSGERIRLGALEDRLVEALRPPWPSGARAPQDWSAAVALWSTWLDVPRAPRPTAAALLTQLTVLGASDLHIEPGPHAAALRVRIEGGLSTLATLRPSAARALTAVLKAESGCLPYRSDVVQEGRLSTSLGGPARVSFVPTPHGDRVALRRHDGLRDVDALGLEAEVLQDLLSAVEARQGLVLIAGSTGAGKTTTLYALLAHLARRRRGAHLSLEQPIECDLRSAGVEVDQVELDPERGLSADALLVAALRQDVDVIALGEIRTSADAATAVQAARTGRLVLAALHAGGVMPARRRLEDLGVSARDVEDCVVAILHQELTSDACGCAAGCTECRGTQHRQTLRAQWWGK